MPDPSGRNGGVPQGVVGRFASETDADRLRGVTAIDALSIDLVSAYAGDRPLTHEEETMVRTLQDSRGGLFFPDLIYAMTHQYFAPEIAERMWNGILRHRGTMAAALGRSVSLLVASLDYLSAEGNDVRSPTIIAEAHIARIVDTSMRDGLTGFFNHTSFFEIIRLELRRYRRYGTVVSLILCDIDDFKAVNDECGHQEGDRILAELADALEAGTRESDICCRYGGEEFAVVLPMTDRSEAAQVAERIRLNAMGVRAGSRSITVSSGVAECDTNTGRAHEFVKLSDNALYRAKAAGKNCVVVE